MCYCCCRNSSNRSCCCSCLRHSHSHSQAKKKVVETRLVEGDRRLLAHIVIGEVRARAVGGEVGLVKAKSKVNLCRGKSPFQLGIASLINPSCQTHVGSGAAHVGTNPPINQAWLESDAVTRSSLLLPLHFLANLHL